MQVTETTSDGLKRELKVVLSNSEIEEKLEFRLKELGRSVTVPGFRPGRAPMAMLKQRFGKSVLSEIVQGAVADGSSQAMMERGLRPAVQPKVEITAFEEGADLEFTIEVEVLPEIEPIAFGELELERLVIDVSDKEVDSALNHLAEHSKDAAPVTAARPAKTGDIVHIDFVGRIDGKEFPGSAAEAYRLELGSRSFVPGFEDQLVGAKVGDQVDVKIKFPDDYPNPEIAGKEAVFDVTVKDLMETAVPALDDEFARKAGAADLASLRSDLRQRIEEQYAGVARDKVKRELFDALADRCTFSVPQGMLATEFDSIWKQVEKDKAQGTLPEEDIDKGDDELKEEYRGIAERRIRLGLLLSDIGERNGIQVSQDEVSRAVMEEAQKHPGHEREVLEHYHNSPEASAALRAPVFENKVVDFLLEQVKLTDRRISVEELVAETEAAETPPKTKKKAAGKSGGKSTARKSGARKTGAKTSAKKKSAEAEESS
ncbi:MAG: trigger factor [Alphaproteobacteria bacterium]|nr:trigger factor [Alphaproteobacteria bacterium]